MPKTGRLQTVFLVLLIALVVRGVRYFGSANVSLYLSLPSDLQEAVDFSFGGSTSNGLANNFAILPSSRPSNDGDADDDNYGVDDDASIDYIIADDEDYSPFQAPEITEKPYSRQKQKLTLEERYKKTTTILSQYKPKETSIQAQPQSQNTTFKSKIVLPNVLIAGAQKAGSSALSNWLFRAGVCKATVFPGEPVYYSKEVHFFGVRARYAQGLPFYARRYEKCHFRNRTMIARFRLDATPTTLLHPDEVYSFYHSVGGRHLENLRIIVSLREPIARELSLYNHQLSRYQKDPDPKAWYATIATANGTIKSFDTFIETVTIPGLNNPRQASSLANYAQHLRRWFELFDPQQILILSYQHDIRESGDAQDRVRQFLNYPFEGHGPLAESNTHAGKSKLRTITCAARDRLHTLLQPRNEDLYRLLASYPRPATERQPFPPFTLPECTP